MDTLSAQDASFLHIERSHHPMHVGSVIVFEGPPPPFGDLVELMESKLDLVPRYRQKVRFVPLGVARPVWIDDPDFNVSYHLRHTALPAPGTETELLNLASRVMSVMLDRAKPLWEMWLVEGLEEGRWALINKVHHAMVDGVSGMDLTAVILEASRDAARPKASPPRTVDREPNPVQLLARVGLRQPFQLARAIAGGIRKPLDAVRGIATAARGLTAFAPLLRPNDSTLSGPVGPHRRYVWGRADLDDVKVIRRGLGGTVNDVVLAAVTRGFRELLLSRGESVEGRVVRTLVPVSVRSAEERGTYNNRVSALFADLPVGISDPLERLSAIRSQMETFKSSGRAVAADTLVGLAGFAPALLLDLAARLGARSPLATFDTATTNIPGPQVPLYMLGRQMLEIFPFVPIAARVRITTGIFSYNGGMTFGINGDYDAVPDISVFAHGIESEIGDLLKLARS